MSIAAYPAFGILLSIISFEIGKILYRKFRIPIFNPLLIAMILVIAVLSIFKIPFKDYNQGGKYITFFLGPATVALALPLYKQSTLLKKHIIPIIAGVIAGSFTSVITVYLLTRLFGLDRKMTVSLLPKSITTPIGMSVSKAFGGEVPITILIIIITGILGAIISPFILGLFRIKNKIAKGLAIGASAHAVGTSKAIEIGEIEGAMSGLAIGLTGLVTVIIIPWLIKLFGL